MRRAAVVTAFLAVTLDTGVAHARGMIVIHATRRALARKIAARGFAVRRMRPTGRFGKGLYASRSRVVARAEKPGARALVRVRASTGGRKHVIDTRRMKPKAVCSLAGVRDCRGAVHRGVVGPKVGRRLGNVAARRDSVVRYRSRVRPHGWHNLFVPARVYRRHPGRFRVVGVEQVRQKK